MEPDFEAASDAWFDLGLKGKRAVFEKCEYVQQGDVVRWLDSDAFGLERARSIPGENAIVAATALMDEGLADIEAITKVDQALHRAGLSGIDEFWVAWRHFRDRVLGPSRTPPGTITTGSPT